MFKAFSKGFNELFGGFVVIFGFIGGFIGFIYLLVQTVKFFESIIGTPLAITVLGIFVVLMACIGHGLYRMSLYRKAKKKYDKANAKYQKLISDFELISGHRNTYMFNDETYRFKELFEKARMDIKEAEEEMYYWEGK